ncbi:DNA repair protein RecN [Simiduia agarivorans]|uniref:DNA repair protein RecN n=1 Tax=Simiduia agarivorans (strain DSM 21679 / JCM 13881 / BCRC 17597 / SA1) TaxID=1117647 RepID=K4KN09_SIMAS|nr:DNA repair protein RecN [Simiduia agarivorans]AFV00560.1 DNA repair protein RecN [Simiduia agarivorans SA1 = DSM 21679]
MLTLLCIRNFTLVEQLDLELHDGLTAITGETGAGKSLLLDALGMALGEKADADKVRHGCQRAEVSATFDITQLPRANKWLKNNDFETDSECILRRTLTAEGRSRAFINGQSATLAQLKTLGELLLDIHSQHAHQNLLKPDHQRALVDQFGGHTSLYQAVKASWKEWQSLAAQLQYQRDNEAEMSARSQLLRYQVEELDQLNLQPGELEQLESEHRQQANAEQVLTSSQQLAALCSDDEQGLLDGLRKGLWLLRELPDKSSQLQEAEQLLINAQIHIEEAVSAIEHHIDSFEADPERLQWLEARLDSIYQIARKHRVSPGQLTELHQQLAEELAPLAAAEGGLDGLAHATAEAELNYRKLATELSQQRKQAATQLSRGINRQLQQLSMAGALVDIAVTDADASATGTDAIAINVATNPGQPARPMAKVVSGGELSRISLAIQVCVANKSTIPTLVFDEVDVGIGGATADIVGRLLRQLGKDGQVICVTHLAQVASKAHQHLQVRKLQRKGNSQSTLVHLAGEEKIEEIARMMGGVELTEQTRAHAREMLELSC